MPGDARGRVHHLHHSRNGTLYLQYLARRGEREVRHASRQADRRLDQVRFGMLPPCEHSLIGFSTLFLRP